MKSNIRCVQANLQHAKAATYVLSRIFKEEQLDIAFIQEPWTSNTDRVNGVGNISGKVLTAGSGGKPRACILIRNNIEYFVLSGYCTPDVVAVQLKIPMGRSRIDIIACSAYFPGDRDAGQPPPNVVRELIAYSKRKKYHVIIACDANAHHTAWESTNINQRGESLFDYILGEGLIVNNVGFKPTFVTRNRKEVLDLTISSLLMGTKITNWRVSSEISCSDHKHILFNIEAGPRSAVTYRDVRGTDWAGYKSSLQSGLMHSITTIKNRDEIDIANGQICSAIISAYHENSPLKTKKDNRGASWWNKKLDKMRKEVRRLFNRAKDSGNWDQYRSALTDYNKEIRKAKRESWRRFCESITDVSRSTRIHKILSRGPMEQCGSVKRPDGSYTDSEMETLQLLALNHFPGSLDLDDEPLSTDGSSIAGAVL